MAYFRCQQGSSSGGAGATITVTYDSSFYNKTMTCTNGTKTYTKTTTSSGSTTFNVNEEGTWTITCDGVSRTVNVVLSYSTQMAITKTITIYGANEDYITYTDATGSKACQFASGATSKSVSITFIPPSATITFTSTVAKNPNNLSQNYSKAITITENTTSIYVMPDNVLYWYGNKVNITTSTYGSSWTKVEPTWNTNNATVTLSGTLRNCHFVPLNEVTTNTTHCIATSPSNSNQATGVFVGDTSSSTFASSNSPAYLSHTNATAGTPKVIVTNGSQNGTTWTMTLYALWYE